MLEKIGDLIAKVKLDYWTLICLGVLALVFIVGLILSLASGGANRFKKIAKRAISDPSSENLEQTASRMPAKVRNQYKTAQTAGVKPGDVITVDACVHSPFALSVASRFGTAVMAASLFMVAFVFVVGLRVSGVASPDINGVLAATAVVIAAGMVLRFLAGMVSMGVQTSCVRAYDRYVALLDKVFAERATEGEPFDPILPPPEPDEAASDEENRDEPAPASDSEPEQPEAPQAEDRPASRRFDEQFVNYAASVSEPESPLSESGSEAREREEQARLRAEAAANARAEAAAKTQTARTSGVWQTVRAEQPAQIPERTQEEPPRSVAAPASVSGADEVVARIDRISREGGSLAAMKEAALMLQQERAKPENKTPELQRKLNDALSVLLKAMNTATRR